MGILLNMQKYAQQIHVKVLIRFKCTEKKTSNPYNFSNLIMIIVL